jgi:hypothetical protein
VVALAAGLATGWLVLVVGTTGAMEVLVGAAGAGAEAGAGAPGARPGDVAAFVTCPVSSNTANPMTARTTTPVATAR